MTPAPHSGQSAGSAANRQSKRVDSSPSVVKSVVGVWVDGFGVMGHLMWFSLHLCVLLIPWQLVAVLVTGKTDATVYANGQFDGRAAIAGVLLLIYFPVACHWASRTSGCFRSRGGRGK